MLQLAVWTAQKATGWPFFAPRGAEKVSRFGYARVASVGMLAGMSNVSETREGVALFVLEGQLGRAEFDRYLHELDAALAAARPFAMVVDGSAPGLEIAETPNRRWQLSRAIEIGKYHRGIAFVTGTMTRERVQALYALQPPGVPYAFFSDRAEAVEWARAALDGEAKAVLGEHKTVPIMSVVRG